MPTPQHASLLAGLTPDQRRFWWAFFVPVNLVFLPGWFAVESFQPDLDSALLVVALVKLGYLLTVCWGVYALATVWQDLAGAASRATALALRLVGVASVGGLLLAHAAAIHGYGAMEREMVRDVRTTQRSLPLRQGEGVLMERMRLEKRDVVYEYRLTSLLAEQVSPAQFHGAAFASAKAGVCADRTLADKLRHGVRLRFVYVDKNHQPLAVLVFDGNACAGQPA